MLRAFIDVVVLICVSQYLEFCDNIMLVNNGVVQEAGNHQDLMRADNHYAQLISNYQMGESEVKSKTFKPL